jgi:monoamine oxidase
MGLSRRAFLHRVGAAGGYGAAYSAMVAMGLLATPASGAAAPRLPRGLGRKTSIVVLGGGIAGLVTAYELERAGFKVTLLEARDRLGGRNWTLRGGSKIEMAGELDQTAAFSKGLYMNAGPSRIPSHHERVLRYCRDLGVTLEVEVNSSRGALFQDKNSNGGKPIQMRQGVNDTRGYIAELLAKAIRKGALDQDLSAEDKARLLPFLKTYGDLTGEMAFKGTERSGLAQLPAAATELAAARPPVPLHDLLANSQLGSTLFDEDIYMQATMFQPVGGMDRIPAAFERAIASPVMKNAEVTAIRQADQGVNVSWRDRATGAGHLLEADYAVITIPLPVLANIDNDFDPQLKQAIAATPHGYANKIGFEAPRFWERQQIYGGLSFVGGETDVIWYPSGGMHTERGVLLACFNAGLNAKTFAARPLAEQIAMARQAVDSVHPGHGRELERPIVVNWTKVPFSLGPWVAYGGPGWREGHIEDPNYRLLNQPHGRVYFAGDHVSQLPGWQEGAVASAHRTIALLGSRIAEG